MSAKLTTHPFAVGDPCSIRPLNTSDDLRGPWRGIITRAAPADSSAENWKAGMFEVEARFCDGRLDGAFDSSVKCLAGEETNQVFFRDDEVVLYPVNPVTKELLLAEAGAHAALRIASRDWRTEKAALLEALSAVGGKK